MVDNEWDAYKALKKDTLNEFAKSYKTRLMSLIKEETPFLVNKMPSNYLYLGLIKLLFPNAKIIHTQRHPGDTCTSCFFQNFINGNEYSFDAVHLGYYYREYLKLMDHWRYTLGGGVVFDLKYEALVSNPEKEIRKLLKFCGLDWEEACLKPEKLKRYVATASLAQVRKPINTSSIGRWENYSPWLKSLMRIDDLIKDYENSIV